MSEIKGGGYVYPTMGNHVALTYGITRRDWLAGLAMQGLLMGADNIQPIKLSGAAYQLADAIIKEGQ